MRRSTDGRLLRGIIGGFDAQSCHQFQANRNFFRFYDARLKYYVCNRTPLEEGRWSDQSRSVEKLQSENNRERRQAWKTIKCVLHKLVFCYYFCFTSIHSLSLESCCFESLIAPAESLKVKLTWQIQIPSAASSTCELEWEIDEWSQKSQLKLNVECIAAQYSKFSRLWYSHFFISFIICWLLSSTLRRAWWREWGARWSEWKIISVDCMTKIIFERLNSRWIGWLRSVEKWQEKHSTISENAFIWGLLFSLGALRRTQLLEFKRWKSRPESFHNFIDKKAKRLEKIRDFNARKPRSDGAKQKQHREAAQMENYEENSVQQSWLRSKNWKTGNEQHFNEIRDLFHVAHFISSTRRRSSSHWPYLRKRA